MPRGNPTSKGPPMRVLALPDLEQDKQWVVQRTFAWLNQFRRLRVRYDRLADIHEAFLSLGWGLICWQFLRKGWRTG